ncbi:unnamed protein product [Lepidochelys olivacea]
MNFKRLTKVLTCLSLLTELLALVSPYWMEVGSPGFEASMGLWNICLNWFCSKLPMGTGIVTLASVLVFRVSFSTSGPFHPELNRRHSWSFYVGCVASFLFLLSALVSAITHIQCHETPAQSHTQVAPQQGGLQPGSTARLHQDQARQELPPPV